MDIFLANVHGSENLFACLMRKQPKGMHLYRAHWSICMQRHACWYACPLGWRRLCIVSWELWELTSILVQFQANPWDAIPWLTPLNAIPIRAQPTGNTSKFPSICSQVPENLVNATSASMAAPGKRGNLATVFYVCSWVLGMLTLSVNLFLGVLLIVPCSKWTDRLSGS